MAAQGPASSTTARRTAVTLQRSKRHGWRAVDVGYAELKNNLLAAVGYLELANAGDFAANVWNTIPVPRHAVILMAIGGPIALLMALFAARDFYLSLQNVSLLFSERRAIQSRRATEAASSILGVNAREIGTELFDRIFMDLLLGFGSLLVGTGTIMAIWGADRHVFQASNLLSGFVGNGFPAAFGVANAGWSIYLVYRFQARYVACTSEPALDRCLQTRVRRRFGLFQWHAIILGINGLVAGMASMVTARMWWGYVVLVPCVAVMIAGNLFWRTKLGYDRPVPMNLLDDDSQRRKREGENDDNDGYCDVLGALASVTAAQGTLSQIAGTGSLDAVLSFIVQHRLLELFCMWISRAWPEYRVFSVPPEETLIHIVLEDLTGGSEEEDSRMACECRRFLDDVGKRVLEHRERYLLELVGEVVWRGACRKY